jgi:DNA-binding response OmpR family regulator
MCIINLMLLMFILKNLRKKLEASSGKKYIRTIRNVGYRFSIEGIEENA